MKFRRKQRIKGRSAKTYKEWYDETGRYRISWRSQVYGVEVPPAYYACVRCLRGRKDDFQFWGFVGRRGPYKTRAAAIKECEHNKATWEKFLAIDGQAKVSQVRALEASSRVGRSRPRSIMRDFPIWVLNQASPRLLDILCGNDQSDPSETSPSSSDAESPSLKTGKDDTKGVGPVWRAEGPEQASSSHCPSMKTNEAADVQSAKAPAKAPRKPAAKRTAKRSTVGKKKRKSTTASKKSGTRRSKGSRKTKSKPSAS